MKGGIMNQLREWRREWWWWWIQLRHRDRVRIRRLRALGLVSASHVYEADHRRLGTSAAYDANCPICQRRGKRL